LKLFEYRGKELMSRYGIPVPQGRVVSSPDEIDEMKAPGVLKAQVLVGGRGKAGGIKFASSVEEARKVAAQLLGMSIHGERVRRLLIEERLNVAKELYFSYTLDRSSRSIVMMASAEGGMEIESVEPSKIAIRQMPPFGYTPFITRTLQKQLKLNPSLLAQMEDIAKKLYTLFITEDCELAEINPLVITSDGKMVAADAKITVNDDALFRHPEFSEDVDDLTPLELKAKKESIAFVQLDGDIGVIANGAGLTMATLDMLSSRGGKAGVFLDLGGTDDPEKVAKAFALMKEANPRVIFLNIFGGITKCDTVALGVKEAISREHIDIPVVARIRGVNEAEAKEILNSIGIVATTDMREAASRAVEAGR
jgi:succinyl-CoA synthetase beta subunit